MKRYYESTRIANLLAKLATQNISESEKQELASLVEKSGMNAGDILKKAAYKSADTSEIEAGEKVWASVLSNISRPNRRFGHRLLRYAAIFIAVATLSLGAYFLRQGHFISEEPITLLANETILEYPSGERVVLKDKTDIKDILQHASVSAEKEAEKKVAATYKINVSRGSTHTVTLEDGTNIILYPESELQFPEFFSSSERSVTLTGEGYFNVQKDSSRPFTVHAGGASIVVLGTSFNVRAYSNEPTIETVLVTGKVVMNNRVLLPDQMAIYDSRDDQVRIENMDATIYLERAQGMFIFENKSLDEIMREFSLWFGFEYNFENNALKDKKFRFKLPHTDNFNYLMSLMEKTGELQFDVSAKTVTILPGKQ